MPRSPPALTLDSVWNAESRAKLRANLLERAGDDNAIYVDRALASFDHAAELWVATATSLAEVLYEDTQRTGSGR